MNFLIKDRMSDNEKNPSLTGLFRYSSLVRKVNETRGPGAHLAHLDNIGYNSNRSSFIESNTNIKDSVVTAIKNQDV